MSSSSLAPSEGSSSSSTSSARLMKKNSTQDVTWLLDKGWRRKGALYKRSQGKGSLPLKKKFQKRTFVLSEDALTYFEGSDLHKVKFKGQILIKSIRAVEVLDSSLAFGRPAMFQIVHDEAILYLQAKTQAERADWLDALRSTCELPDNLAIKHEQYHPGVYRNNEWTCCKLKNKPSGGCKAARKYYAKPLSAPAPSPTKAPHSDSLRFRAAHNEEVDALASYVDYDSEEDPDELSDARLEYLPDSVVCPSCGFESNSLKCVKCGLAMSLASPITTEAHAELDLDRDQLDMFSHKPSRAASFSSMVSMDQGPGRGSASDTFSRKPKLRAASFSSNVSSDTLYSVDALRQEFRGLSATSSDVSDPASAYAQPALQPCPEYEAMAPSDYASFAATKLQTPSSGYETAAPSGYAAFAPQTQSSNYETLGMSSPASLTPVNPMPEGLYAGLNGELRSSPTKHPRIP